jgi:hypothetical protein
MSNPITVKEMLGFCKELVKNGHGDKYCFVTTDEEGNDYRPLWFKPTSNPDEVARLMMYSCSGLGKHDPKKIVMFG